MATDRARPPVVRPYFYDARGRIRKNSSTESLLRVAITKLPILIPKITLPTYRSVPFRPEFDPTTRRSVSRYRRIEKVEGSCGLRREVFVMEDGAEVDELRHFPGFRYVVEEGGDEEQRFWTECWERFHSFKYQYLFLSSGKRIRSILSVPEGTKLVLVGCDCHCKGVRWRHEEMRLRVKEAILVPLIGRGTGSTQSSPKPVERRRAAHLKTKSQSIIKQPRAVD